MSQADPLPFYSVIIPHYNDKEGLSECLSALAQQDFPQEKYEVIVIDDCSAEDYTDYFQSHFPFAGFYRQPTNKGPAAARNRGISLAQGTYLVFTDSDVCPGPSWLSTFTEGFSSGTDILCGPVFHGPNILERLTALTACGEYLENNDGFRNHCPGGNFAVKASVIEGFFFDEDVEFAGEDTLLSTRLAASGHTIRYLAAAWVIHKPKISITSYARRAFRYGIGFRGSRMRCPFLSGYWLHKYLRCVSGLPLFFIRTGIDLRRLAMHRKLLQINLLNLPVFVLGVLATRLFYATGVFWSYFAPHYSHEKRKKIH